MDTRTPPIRVIALCLLSHPSDASRILVSRKWDSAKGSHFCRPLGGGIEFGERAHNAVRREILEELEQEISEVRLLSVAENIFGLEGQPGHEIVFLFDARFKDASLYDRAELAGHEASVGEDFVAFWSTAEEIAARGERLVPEALAALLKRGTNSTC